MFVAGVILLPALASAQSSNNSQTVDSILARIQGIMSIIIPIIMSLALLYFLWGLAHYVLGAGDEEKRKEGRDMMVYGIIALFVMAAVWGLVTVIGNTFDITTGGGTPPLPTIPIIQ